jgi:hypothetical protein
MITISGPWNPCIARSSVDGKLYAHSGSVSVEVPEGTSLSNLNWIRPKRIKPKEQVSKTLEKIVTGSKGNKYIVKYNTVTKKKTCTCPGFNFRRKCKHLEELK